MSQDAQSAGGLGDREKAQRSQEPRGHLLRRLHLLELPLMRAVNFGSGRYDFWGGWPFVRYCILGSLKESPLGGRLCNASRSPVSVCWSWLAATDPQLYPRLRSSRRLPSSLVEVRPSTTCALPISS